jgi:hypothetical protein
MSSVKPSADEIVADYVVVDGDLATLGMMSQPVTSERFWGDPSGAWHRSPYGDPPARRP